EDAAGNVIQTPQVGAAFNICYAVRFDREQQSVLFGLRLSSIRGDWILGTNTAMHGIVTPSYHARQVEVVRWPAQAGLGVGEYFITCGCAHSGVTTADDSSQHFLLREVDAYQFSVRANASSQGLCRPAP